IDERRLTHVNIKLEGWIDELFVNSTGERVKKGQKLLTLYSPELVATQTEYLLALKSQRTLGKSPFPEVAEGAESHRRQPVTSRSPRFAYVHKGWHSYMGKKRRAHYAAMRIAGRERI